MNKTALIASTLLALSAVAPLAGAQTRASGGAEVVLQVQDVRAGRGPLMIAVFDSEAAWRGDETNAVRRLRVSADAETVSVRVPNLAPGAYAIRLYQDVDANGDLNTGMLGIPTEPYAFSNDAPIRFGPPSWSAARFTVTAEGARQSVTLTP